jgi:phage baseplate assembly protein W
MPGNFLGVGWNFPIEIIDGRVRLAEYEESVRQSIWTILSTSQGERVMRPDFGCGLSDLVFSLNNASTAGRVAFEVRHALDQWEPRVETLSVKVSNTSRPEVLEIHLECRIFRTNTRLNMVYPFYLRTVRNTR